MKSKDTETLDKLYLEWSQFTLAKTQKEIDLEIFLEKVKPQLTGKDQRELVKILESDKG
jgi:hypothetical protein